MKRYRCLAAGIPALMVASVAVAAASGWNAPPTREPSAPLTMKPVLSLEAAQFAAQAGLDEAGRLSAGGAIAVTDDAGSLICLVRLDGTFPAASEVAHAKARTASLFRRPTKDFEDAVKGGRNTLLAVAPMTPLEGGVPIVVGGNVIGAVGVNGAHSSTEDVRIATFAAQHLMDQLETLTPQSHGESR